VQRKWHSAGTFSTIKRLSLNQATPEERTDLIEFLKSLTDRRILPPRACPILGKTQTVNPNDEFCRSYMYMKIARLLVVEDDPDNLALLTIVLREKYIVLAHGSAAEAMMDVLGFNPNLLVLDVGMLPVNGLECLSAIRSLPGYSGIPAIALTGFAREADKKMFLEAGFQAVVTKPILDQRELQRLIETLLGVAPVSPSLQDGVQTGALT
jgi:CheY-like chemotaxis protein